MLLAGRRLCDSSRALMVLAMLMMVSRSSESSLYHGRHRRQMITFEDNASDCTTPDKVPGTCKPLTSCQSLFTKLKDRPSLEFIKFLRKSICRFEKTTPVVCCAKTRKITKPVAPIIPLVGTNVGADPPTTETDTIPPTTIPTTTFPSTTASTTTTTSTTPIPITEPPLSGFDLLPRSCGLSNHTASRIVGGKESEQGAFPWLSALGYEDGRGSIDFLCGGALITSRHVVTAAHCVHNRPDLSIVRLGEHDLRTPDEAIHEDLSIKEVIINENFDTTSFENDIAIIVLERDVEFRADLSPICLPLVNHFKNNTLEGINAFVAGWGSVSYNNVSSPILKEVQLPIVNTATCAQQFSVFRTVKIGDTTLCAGRGGEDACQGDSGGPMMAYWDGHYNLAGIVSLGFRCAEPNFPGVYTRVTEYINWIEASLN